MFELFFEHFRVNVADALDWLIDHEDDTDDDDIEFPTLNLDLETAGPSSQSMCKRTSLKNACKNLFKKGNFNSKTPESFLSFKNATLFLNNNKI